MPTLEDHPIAALFPLMTDAEIDALGADIEAKGLLDPIWLYEGKILDGRNRYRACMVRDIDHRVEQYKGKDPLGFSISKNLPRRHLTESQRAMIAAEIASGHHGGDRKSDQAANLPLDPVTQKEAAAKLQVAERTVRDAVKVNTDGVPELAAAVKAGEVSVSAAAEVAKLSKKEQKKAVKDGTVKETAAAKRKGKGKAGTEDTLADPCEAFVARLNRLCRLLDGAKKEAEECSGVAVFGKHIHCESVTYQIEAARKALWQSRPTDACNCLNKKGEAKPECKACYGCGKCPAARVLKGSR